MFKRFTLPNGIRVIFVPHTDTKAITLLTLFRVGSRFEEAKTLGISHFLEHMMFKGTKKRPETIQISRELDGVGAQYNAFTGKDHTGYYIKLNYEKTEMAIDLMYDMLANSLLAAEEIERERKVIQEEINMYEDNPLMLVDELFEEELFKGSSLGWRIAGNAETLSHISRKEIVAFRKEFYRPKETVFVAAGRLPDNLETLLKRTFAKVRSNDGRSRQPKPFSMKAIPQKGPRVALRFRDTGQVQVALGFPAYPIGHADLPALQVLSNILGGTMSSRLFISVREKRGLAYMVRSGVNPYEDVGNIMIQAGLDKSRVDEALKVIMDELAKLTKSGVTPAELASAKENIRGRLILGLEDSENTADFFGKQELHSGKVQTPDERLQKILAVKPADVRRVAKEIFKPAALAAAVIGPFDDIKRFEKLFKS
ncbi:MAG: pitrilysin family protein [bacterium]|nr:pitrilysin family protein [bacterium]